MEPFEKKIMSYKNMIKEQYVSQSSIDKVADLCKEQLKERGRTNGLEFLYQQMKFIKKRWWVLQGFVLLGLWGLLQQSDNRLEMARLMGIAAATFSVLVVPELWKNRNSYAIEIEEAAYYSLRQIYSARILLFAIIDVSMVTLFIVFSSYTLQISLRDLLIHFLIPFNVSGCICFKMFCSKKNETEYFAVGGCVIGVILWSMLVANEKVYSMIAESVWLIMIVLSSAFLIYFVISATQICELNWEEKWDGIKT